METRKVFRPNGVVKKWARSFANFCASRLYQLEPVPPTWITLSFSHPQRLQSTSILYPFCVDNLLPTFHWKLLNRPSVPLHESRILHKKSEIIPPFPICRSNAAKAEITCRRLFTYFHYRPSTTNKSGSVIITVDRKKASFHRRINIDDHTETLSCCSA